MGNDLIVAGTQPNTFKIAASSTIEEQRVIEKFLSGQSSLLELLRGLGFAKTPRRFLLDKDPLKPLGHLLLSRSHPYLFRTQGPEFPENIKVKLRSLSCAQLLAAIPKSGKVEDPAQIVENLVHELGNNAESLAQTIGLFLYGDKNIEDQVAQVIDQLRTLQNADFKQTGQAAPDFIVALCEITPKYIPALSQMLFIKFEADKARRIADRLLNSEDASVREQASVFLNLDPETFVVLASNLVDVSASDLDSEKNETSQIAALSTSTPNLDLDEWLADRLKNLITGNLESADRNQPQPIFDFEDFKTMRLAFTANQFPKMAATLIHVGINFYPHEIVAMTLASIDSLRDPSTSNDTMKKFLQSLLTDAELLASNGGITLLEDLKEILTQRFQLPIESLAFDEVLRHEIEFAVRIACANGITLSPTLEALVTHSDELSSIYLKDGKVSVGFLDQAVSKGQAKTLISLLEIIEQYPKAQNLSASQLETIADRLPEVFDSAVELGRKVNAPTESIGHLYDAARLLELEGCISSALQTLDMPDHSQIFPRT